MLFKEKPIILTFNYDCFIEAARLLKSKIKELESQKAKLLLAFAKTQDATDLTEPAVNMVCRFLVWLRKNDYLLLDAKRMVRLNLKFD